MREPPPSHAVGLLAYRARRNVLLDLAGWDQRKDRRAITAGKLDIEAEQRDVFAAEPATQYTMPLPMPRAAGSGADE